MKILLAVLIMIEFLFRSELSKGESIADIRLYNDFNLPLEPSTLFSMSEYNLALCIFSTIFEMGESSVPESKILESWRYSESGSFYDFVIKKGVVWSDGRPLTSSDIKESIVRLKNVAPAHYLSIASLLSRPADSEKNKESGLEIVSDSTLRIRVVKPNPDLFARLTGVFIPIIRKDILDSKTLRVARHDITLAPYYVDQKNTDNKHLTLKKNTQYFDLISTMAETIEMRPYNDKNPVADDILKPSFWPNLLLDRAFTTQDAWSRLKEKHISIWTRPVDRILYIYPTKFAASREDIYSITRWLGDALSKNPIDFSKYPGLKPARSLQPKGFFLYDEINYEAGQLPKKDRKYHIAIGNSQIPAQHIIDELAKHKLQATFEQFPVARLKDIQKMDRFDFIISSFGAADPDPVTWLSLVLGNDHYFIADYDHLYRNEFEVIKSEKNDDNRVIKLRNMLRRAGEKGLYIPLAHFSSIAVASNGLDLGRISEADETVNLSRVIVNRNAK